MLKIKKVLITGFEPFGVEKTNPPWEDLMKLTDTCLKSFVYR